MQSPDRVRPATFVARSLPFVAAVALLISGLAGCGGSGSDACAIGERRRHADDRHQRPRSGRGHGRGHVRRATASGMVTCRAGPHAVTAARVTSPQTGITSQVFAARSSVPTACVRAGATTDRQRDLCAGPDQRQALGRRRQRARRFDDARVRARVGRRHADSVADVAANTGGSDGFTFDRAGNIWVLGGTTADPPLARYAAALFATDGVKVPDVTIESPSFGSHSRARRWWPSMRRETCGCRSSPTARS